MRKMVKSWNEVIFIYRRSPLKNAEVRTTTDLTPLSFCTTNKKNIWKIKCMIYKRPHFINISTQCLDGRAAALHVTRCPFPYLIMWLTELANGAAGQTSLHYFSFKVMAALLVFFTIWTHRDGNQKAPLVLFTWLTARKWFSVVFATRGKKN